MDLRTVWTHVILDQVHTYITGHLVKTMKHFIMLIDFISRLNKAVIISSRNIISSSKMIMVVV